MDIKEKFYSDKNKLHIFKILQKHIKDNFNVNITIKNDVDSFYENIDTIFNEKNNTDELTDLNKKLIDVSYNSYLNKYNLNDLKYINSGNRISGNRYEYLYKIDTNITKINKLCIPIEDNTLFLNLFINLKIKELNVNTNCKCIDTIQLNNYMIGVYEPEKKSVYTKHKGNINIKLSNIFLDTKISEDIYPLSSYEKSKINLIKKGDFKIDDIIQVRETKHTFNIDKVTDNGFIINNINNINIKTEHHFINSSIQNIIEYE